MPAVQETVDRVRQIDVDQYKYGFVTDIESEKAPIGHRPAEPEEHRFVEQRGQAMAVDCRDKQMHRRRPQVDGRADERTGRRGPALRFDEVTRIRTRRWCRHRQSVRRWL